MATPSKAKRAAHKHAAVLRHTAENAAPYKGWKVSGDTRKGMTVRFGIAK